MGIGAGHVNVVTSLRREAAEGAVEARYLLGFVDEEGDFVGPRHSLCFSLEARAIVDALPARELFVDVHDGDSRSLGHCLCGKELQDAALPDTSLAGDQFDQGRAGEGPDALKVAGPWYYQFFVHASNIMDKIWLVNIFVHHDGQS